MSKQKSKKKEKETKRDHEKKYKGGRGSILSYILTGDWLHGKRNYMLGY
jgi:hypothetical protein